MYVPCMYLRMYVCMHVFMHACTHACIQIFGASWEHPSIFRGSVKASLNIFLNVLSETLKQLGISFSRIFSGFIGIYKLASLDP